jgi:hypothetical protein
MVLNWGEEKKNGATRDFGTPEAETAVSNGSGHFSELRK